MSIEVVNSKSLVELMAGDEALFARMHRAAEAERAAYGFVHVGLRAGLGRLGLDQRIVAATDIGFRTYEVLKSLEPDTSPAVDQNLLMVMTQREPTDFVMQFIEELHVAETNCSPELAEAAERLAVAYLSTTQKDIVHRAVAGAGMAEMTFNEASFWQLLEADFQE